MPPVGLIILDGFGVAPDVPSNAITRARKPYIDFLTANYPVVTVHASGNAVGLPWGEMGNSEVGHLTLGAGKILYQDILRINRALTDGSFVTNPMLAATIEHVSKTGGRVHLLGLLSPGGVHSHQDHLWALIDWCKQQNIAFSVHAILDGRDMPFDSGKDFVTELQTRLQDTKGVIASIGGRYWGMDRDNHWERTRKMYDAILGKAPTITDPLAAVKASYQKNVYDEQIEPTTVTSAAGAPVGPAREGDAVIFFNFRPDRTRQLTKMFVLEAMAGVEPWVKLNNLFFVTMTEYEAGLPVSILFPPEHVVQPLGWAVSQAGKTQLHIAETEKYAHVTFFFNGGREEPFTGEDRVLISSPRVASYDQAPEMSAKGVTDAILKDLALNPHDLYVVNYANPDMVGHTGNLPATVEAIEAIDANLERVVEAFLALDGTVFITADHGNAEELENSMTSKMDKEHSTSPVPLYLIKRSWFGKTLPLPDAAPDLSTAEPVGVLADVAPTVLTEMKIAIPSDMTGTSLLAG